MPKAAWLVIAPLAWAWQYLVYVPVYSLTNLVVSAFWVYAAWVPGLRGFGWGDRWQVKIDTRPWFLDKIR